MKNIIVTNADRDGYGAHKENIFIARNEAGRHLGTLLIFPYLDFDIEPEHPHNLSLYLHPDGGKEISEPVKDLLLDYAMRRANEIKQEAGQPQTRVYACYQSHQQEEIAYFLQRGFTHDEGMHIYERNDPTLPPRPVAPEEVSIQEWKMETEAERRRFLEAHRLVFPRHAYSIESLQELMALPGWCNYVAFGDSEIAGNVMLFTKTADNTIGYIEDLFVQKQWRRRGIGRRLLYTALAHFQAASVYRVQLEFWSANKPGLRLYSEFGFTSIAETEIAVGRYV
ncbi:MAG: GNAT family N-acetyltransferase [Anaerolineales bacterium]|jgi:ribosomal protein S18 acetylase RimI-like enzyme